MGWGEPQGHAKTPGMAPMTVAEFCERYMEGKTPVGFQRAVIDWFLDPINEHVDHFHARGGFAGGGKTTVRRALVRYIEDLEQD